MVECVGWHLGHALWCLWPLATIATTATNTSTETKELYFLSFLVPIVNGNTRQHGPYQRVYNIHDPVRHATP